MLTLRELSRATLARQLLLQRESISATEAVERLAGMQAQVPKPPFIGLWTRLTDFDREELRAAIAKKELVRATLMRGTLHLVSRRDYVAWRAALQPLLSATAAALTKNAYDAEELCERARAFFRQPHTFEELREQGFDRGMAYTVRLHLPLVMVPDDSMWSYPPNAKFTLAPRIAAAKPRELVRRYLAAFGPASPADFQAWSGLKNARPLFDDPELVQFGKLFDLPDAPRPDEATAAPVRFLPEFDNLLLAHADRTRIIADEHRPRVATKNLRILATFLVDGFVAGTWSIARKSKKATLTLAPFGKLDRKTRNALVEEGETLVRFAEPEASVFDVA